MNNVRGNLENEVVPRVLAKQAVYQEMGYSHTSLKADQSTGGGMLAKERIGFAAAIFVHTVESLGQINYAKELIGNFKKIIRFLATLETSTSCFVARSHNYSDLRLAAIDRSHRLAAELL